MKRDLCIYEKRPTKKFVKDAHAPASCASRPTRERCAKKKNNVNMKREYEKRPIHV